MIKPTLGRVVWFTPHADVPVVVPDEDGRCAALVCKVESDRKVNLAVFDSLGNHYAMPGVTLLQDDDEPPDSGYYCEWMPYQKGQAQKTEALEKKLEESTAPATMPEVEPDEEEEPEEPPPPRKKKK